MAPIEGRIGGKLTELPPRQRKSQGSSLDTWQALADLERVCSKGLAPGSFEGLVITPDIRKQRGKSVSRRTVNRLRREFVDFPYDIERRSMLNGNEEVLVKYPLERVVGKRTPVVREMPTGSVIRAKAKQTAKSKQSKAPAQESQAATLPAVSQ